MHGASISRWTMAFFAAALTFLVTGLATMGSGLGLPTAAVDAPETLAVVHMIAIGWLALLFCGALLQFVPVLTATHLRMSGLAVPALLSLIAGLSCLVTGFLALGGHVGVDSAILMVGGLLLGLGFSLLAVALAVTIVSSKTFGVSGILVLAGLAALLLTALMGNLFAGVLSGVLNIPPLASRLVGLVKYHAIAGMIGWMTLTAIGVSYKLFGMFMLAPEQTGSQRMIAICSIVALASLPLVIGLACLDSAYEGIVAAFGIGSTMILLAFYLRDILRMFKARRRKMLELNSTAGLAALCFLAAGILLLAPGALGIDLDVPLGVVAFYLLGMGWLSGLGLAQLYKIIPFLTWMETYGPVMGKSEVPRVQDLVDESRAKAWFGIYYAAVCVGAVAVVFEVDLLFQAASWCQCVAVVSLVVEYVRARRLAYAPAQLRLPPGAVMPRLLHANTNSKE